MTIPIYFTKLYYKITLLPPVEFIFVMLSSVWLWILLNIRILCNMKRFYITFYFKVDIGNNIKRNLLFTYFLQHVVNSIELFFEFYKQFNSYVTTSWSKILFCAPWSLNTSNIFQDSFKIFHYVHSRSHYVSVLP